MMDKPDSFPRYPSGVSPLAVQAEPHRFVRVQLQTNRGDLSFGAPGHFASPWKDYGRPYYLHSVKTVIPVPPTSRYLRLVSLPG